MSEEPVYKVQEADDASFYWTLVAANGETLSTSETFGTRWGAERSVKAAKRAAEQASK